MKMTVQHKFAAYSPSYRKGIYNLILAIEQGVKLDNSGKLRISPDRSDERHEAQQFLEREGICVFLEDKMDDQKSVEFESIEIEIEPGHVVNFRYTELQGVNWKKLFVLKKEIAKILGKSLADGMAVLSASDKRLDRDIALGHNSLLLHEREPGIFLKRIKIRPKAREFIRYLLKHKNHSASLEEIRGGLGLDNTNYVLNLKTYINKLCDSHDVTQIIHHFSKGNWGLNPILDQINK